MASGKLIGFYGSWGSGLATLSIHDDDGRHVSVPCDNGPTVRALDAMFPGFITQNHSVDNAAIKGKSVWYGMDDMGLCLGWLMLDDPCETCERECSDACPVYEGSDE